MSFKAVDCGTDVGDCCDSIFNNCFCRVEEKAEEWEDKRTIFNRHDPVQTKDRHRLLSGYAWPARSIFLY